MAAFQAACCFPVRDLTEYFYVDFHQHVEKTFDFETGKTKMSDRKMNFTTTLALLEIICDNNSLSQWKNCVKSLKYKTR